MSKKIRCTKKVRDLLVELDRAFERKAELDRQAYNPNNDIDRQENFASRKICEGFIVGIAWRINKASIGWAAAMVSNRLPLLDFGVIHKSQISISYMGKQRQRFSKENLWASSVRGTNSTFPTSPKLLRNLLFLTRRFHTGFAANAKKFLSSNTRRRAMSKEIQEAEAQLQWMQTHDGYTALQVGSLSALISIAKSLAEIEGALNHLADEDHSFLTRSKF